MSTVQSSCAAVDNLRRSKDVHSSKFLCCCGQPQEIQGCPQFKVPVLLWTTPGDPRMSTVQSSCAAVDNLRRSKDVHSSKFLCCCGQPQEIQGCPQFKVPVLLWTASGDPRMSTVQSSCAAVDSLRRSKDVHSSKFLCCCGQPQEIQGCPQFKVPVLLWTTSGDPRMSTVQSSCAAVDSLRRSKDVHSSNFLCCCGQSQEIQGCPQFKVPVLLWTTPGDPRMSTVQSSCAAVDNLMRSKDVHSSKFLCCCGQPQEIQGCPQFKVPVLLWTTPGDPRMSTVQSSCAAVDNLRRSKDVHSSKFLCCCGQPQEIQGCPQFKVPVLLWTTSGDPRMSTVQSSCAAVGNLRRSKDVHSSKFLCCCEQPQEIQGCPQFKVPVLLWTTSGDPRMSTVQSSCAAVDNPRRSKDVHSSKFLCCCGQPQEIQGCPQFKVPVLLWTASGDPRMFKVPVLLWTTSGDPRMSTVQSSCAAVGNLRRSKDVHSSKFLCCCEQPQEIQGCPQFKVPVLLWTTSGDPRMSTVQSSCAAVDNLRRSKDVHSSKFMCCCGQPQEIQGCPQFKVHVLLWTTPGDPRMSTVQSSCAAVDNLRRSKDVHSSKFLCCCGQPQEIQGCPQFKVPVLLWTTSGDPRMSTVQSCCQPNP